MSTSIKSPESFRPEESVIGQSKAQPLITHSFYQDSGLTTLVSRTTSYSIFRCELGVLAQNGISDGQSDKRIIGHDQQRSVLNVHKAETIGLSYTPYGYSHLANDEISLLAFNGQRLDTRIDAYLLGNGYRAFNATRMRFSSPDTLSPFLKGGLNSYAYCLGDPVNFRDPSGHVPFMGFFKALKARMGISKRQKMAAFHVAPEMKDALNTKFVGFHGTSDSGAIGIMNHGVKSKSKGDSFFVTNTFASASNYASLQSKGAVLAVYSQDVGALRSVSTRSIVKQSNIPQLKIPGTAHASLRFERVLDSDVSSNFNRFMTEQQSAMYWVSEFRKGR